MRPSMEAHSPASLSWQFTLQIPPVVSEGWNKPVSRLSFITIKYRCNVPGPFYHLRQVSQTKTHDRGDDDDDYGDGDGGVGSDDDCGFYTS